MKEQMSYPAYTITFPPFPSHIPWTIIWIISWKLIGIELIREREENLKNLQNEIIKNRPLDSINKLPHYVNSSSHFMQQGF